MIASEIIKLRKELHTYPELSSSEVATIRRIKAFIEKYNPTSIIEKIGGNGLAAVYEFPQKGKTICIRCELDALPIEEENTFSHRSQEKGVSHKCGHDGHMAIVSGLIFWIKNQSFKAGKIILLFQPAEETGEGAARVIKDEKFKNLKTDYIFALHNIPKEPLHSIIVAKKGFSAEVQSLIIRVKGKESHASEPENGRNPAVAISQIITAMSGLNVAQPEDINFTILTPIHINMGQIAYGISPADGELHYTIRTWNTAKMSRVKTEIEAFVSKICQAHKLNYDMEWLEYFPASMNDKKCINYIEKAAQENHFHIIEKRYPFKFGEDFGWFSKEYKTAMFGLGAGKDTAALHHADYDFPDEIIETGIAMFQSIISKILDE